MVIYLTILHSNGSMFTQLECVVCCIVLHQEVFHVTCTLISVVSFCTTIVLASYTSTLFLHRAHSLAGKQSTLGWQPSQKGNLQSSDLSNSLPFVLRSNHVYTCLLHCSSYKLKIFVRNVAFVLTQASWQGSLS